MEKVKQILLSYLPNNPETYPRVIGFALSNQPEDIAKSVLNKINETIAIDLSEALDTYAKINCLKGNLNRLSNRHELEEMSDLTIGGILGGDYFEVVVALSTVMFEGE